MTGRTTPKARLVSSSTASVRARSDQAPASGHRARARSTLLAAALVLLVATAGCLGSVQPSAAAAGQDASTISVSASGAASADPDLALVRVTVVERAESADAARDRAASSARSMRAALGDLGIDADAILTTAYSLSAEYDDGDERRELVGSVVVHAFEVEVAPAGAGEAIDAAVENGASRVDGVGFTLADETRRDRRADALAAAMSHARADADVLADAAGVWITGVTSVTTADIRFFPFDARLEERAAGTGTTIEPGRVTVSASVHVSYAIE